ncbi:hypothetical protein K504DRAFT_292740 [Pleomassaria siparia CBS 279.74]|uniref:Uncharacterized protein n=1 Tax=Pleomassaria siparia CBS 279.74 TaxID=1314801 RepID=A0A6G1K7V2_9PLEO|nr:hypothetical protein K504DRAFT_292740 [Pleomassaria siparia CBS 279.74]
MFWVRVSDLLSSACRQTVLRPFVSLKSHMYSRLTHQASTPARSILNKAAVDRANIRNAHPDITPATFLVNRVSDSWSITAQAATLLCPERASHNKKLPPQVPVSTSYQSCHHEVTGRGRECRNTQFCKPGYSLGTRKGDHSRKGDNRYPSREAVGIKRRFRSGIVHCIAYPFLSTCTHTRAHCQSHPAERPSAIENVSNSYDTRRHIRLHSRSRDPTGFGIGFCRPNAARRRGKVYQNLNIGVANAQSSTPSPPRPFFSLKYWTGSSKWRGIHITDHQAPFPCPKQHPCST